MYTRTSEAVQLAFHGDKLQGHRIQLVAVNTDRAEPLTNHVGLQSWNEIGKNEAVMREDSAAKGVLGSDGNSASTLQHHELAAL